MTDLDQLDIMRRAITALGLGQCAPEDLVAEAKASSSRREQDGGTIADQRARIKELEVKIASNVADLAAREMRIAELERDLAAKDKSLKTAHAALTRICEVIGAPVPVCPNDAVDAVKTLHAAAESAQLRASQFEGDLLSIGFALNDAGAPTVYDMPDDSERPISDLERIRILGGRLRTERGDREQEALRAQRHADYIRDAHIALDDRGVPRHADGVGIDLAARIRSLPR